MPHLNANIPYIRCFVRDAYLYGDFKRSGITECYIFGVKSILNKPLGFHCQLVNGAVFWSLPISAFVVNGKYERLSKIEGIRLQLLQYWDCQGNDISVTVFAYLQGHRVDCKNRDKQWMTGRYLFTIDDYYADLNSLPLGYANDSDSKCYHFIQLDNGNYCVYPNNFIRWHNSNFCEPYDLKNPPRYRPVQLDLSCE